MKLNPPNAHRSQIKICEKRQTRNVQFRFMPNAFRILKPIQKSSKCVWVFRNTGANAVAKNQTCLAYEDKRDLYLSPNEVFGDIMVLASPPPRPPRRREHSNSKSIQPNSFKFYIRVDTPLRFFAIEIWYPPRTRTTAFAAKWHLYPPNLQNAISP